MLRRKGNPDMSYKPKHSTRPANAKSGRAFKRWKAVRVDRWPPADYATSGRISDQKHRPLTSPPANLRGAPNLSSELSTSHSAAS